MPPRTAVPKRRTQAERRETTRQRLLDGALAELTARGYARLTTPEVCKRAGVSQGALFKHFATKSDLVAAAIEHLFAALVRGYGERFGGLGATGTTIPEAVALLWDVFQDERLHAAYDLYTSARTEPALRAALEPIVKRHGDDLHALARLLFADRATASRERIEDAVDLAILTMQGLVVNEMATGPAPRRERLVPFVSALVEDILAGEPARGPRRRTR